MQLTFKINTGSVKTGKHLFSVFNENDMENLKNIEDDKYTLFTELYKGKIKNTFDGISSLDIRDKVNFNILLKNGFKIISLNKKIRGCFITYVFNIEKEEKKENNLKNKTIYKDIKFKNNALCFKNVIIYEFDSSSVSDQYTIESTLKNIKENISNTLKNIISNYNDFYLYKDGNNIIINICSDIEGKKEYRKLVFTIFDNNQLLLNDFNIFKSEFILNDKRLVNKTDTNKHDKKSTKKDDNVVNILSINTNNKERFLKECIDSYIKSDKKAIKENDFIKYMKNDILLDIKEKSLYLEYKEIVSKNNGWLEAGLVSDKMNNIKEYKDIIQKINYVSNYGKNLNKTDEYKKYKKEYNKFFIHLMPYTILSDFKKAIVAQATNFSKDKEMQTPTQKKFPKVLEEIKENNQDFEFYPTSKEVIKELYKNISADTKLVGDRYYSSKSVSFMDVGAGNGKIFKELETLAKKDDKELFSSKYAIEKSDILAEQIPADVFVIGSDFEHQTFLDKNIDMVYSNPPYSDFASWSVKLIKELSSYFLYLLIPERWKENKEIEEALEFRGATVTTVYNYDFRDSEDRKARAKVDLIRVDFNKNKRDTRNIKAMKDPFNLWFNETFKIKTDSKDDTLLNQFKKEQKNKVENNKSEIVKGGDLTQTLVKLYDKELTKIMTNYKALSSLDASLFEEMKVNLSDLIEGMKIKIKGLKKVYWMEIFNNLEGISKRLTSKSRTELFNKLTQNNNIDFTTSNIKNVLIYVLKNASKYFDTQLTDVYKDLTNKENIMLYKSNKQFVTDDYRFLKDELNKYSLDYRTVQHNKGGLDFGFFGDEKTGNLKDRADIFLNDLIVISENLGFKVDTKIKDIEFKTQIKHNILFKDGSIFMELKFFMNGNIHIKFNKEFMRAFNIEMARINKWIKSPREASQEFEITEDEAKKVFKTNISINNLSLQTDNLIGFIETKKDSEPVEVKKVIVDAPTKFLEKEKEIYIKKDFKINYNDFIGACCKFSKATGWEDTISDNMISYFKIRNYSELEINGCLYDSLECFVDLFDNNFYEESYFSNSNRITRKVIKKIYDYSLKNCKQILEKQIVGVSNDFLNNNTTLKAIVATATNFSADEKKEELNDTQEIINKKLVKSEDSKKSSHALASSNIKKELKILYPNTKFSVTSDSFSGGDSIRVSYYDGVQSDEIEKVTLKYQSGSFNSYEDIYEYSHDSFNYGDAKYIHVERKYSDKVVLNAIDEVCKYWGDVTVDDYSFSKDNGYGANWNHKNIDKFARVSDLLSKTNFYTEPTKPAKEPKKATATKNSNNDVDITEFKKMAQNGDIEDFTHTKTKEVLKVMKLKESLSREEFKSFSKWFKECDYGYYSRYAKGFVITSDSFLKDEA